MPGDRGTAPHDRHGVSAAQLAARAPLTAGGLLGRQVRDGSGRRVGRVVDLIVEKDSQGMTRVKAVVATDGPWGRLLGYERAAARGPWLLELLARVVVRRHLRRVPWDEVHFEE
jgi:sporulation protein YlmC with PRC-barrel domain